MTRTSEEVLQLAEHAKLNINELLPTVQCLAFSDDFGETANEVKLLEVDNHLLNLLCEGQRITIRGDAEDTSVLCTKDSCYEVRQAETSNSLLLVPNLRLAEDLHCDSYAVDYKQVHSIQYKYFELKKCQPRYGKLLLLLEERPFAGRHSDKHMVGFTVDELLDSVQCSEDELLRGLKNFKAYEIGDYWQILSFNYHFDVLSSILNLLDSNSLDIKNINKRSIIDTLKELEPEFILDQCFDYFFKPLDMDSAEGDPLYEIDGVEVSRFCAEVLLKPAGQFNLNDFLQIWKQSVPEGVFTDISHLSGLALVDAQSSPPVAFYFPASKMPQDVAQAFTMLFEKREKWRLEDIAPYLTGFVTDKVTVTVLLNKYARASMVTGVKYFTARHSR